MDDSECPPVRQRCEGVGRLTLCVPVRCLHGCTAQMPHPWFQMLQDEEAPAAEAPAAEAPAPAPAAGAGEAAGGDVVFPDDYPNSVKHFLMLGAVGMLIGAVVFLSLNMLRSKRSTVHSVTFILATVMAMSYYAMWTGLGVTFKTTDTSPRVIFWGRYLGHLIAMPLVLVDLSYACKLDVGAMLTLVCYDIIMYAAGFVGAYSVGGHKWTWWFVSFAFAVLITIQLAKVAMDENASEITKMLTYTVIVATCAFPLMWLLGSEGTAALGLSQEVGIVTIVDLATALGFGLYFLLNYDQVMDEEEMGDSQQYV